MQVFVAEKKTLGMAIADAIPGNKIKHPSHIELGNGDVVTWVRGHFLEQCDPAEYDRKWQKWDLNSLPIKVFKWKKRELTLKGKNPSQREKENVAYVRSQIAVVKSLMERADVIVNAGDPDREGQLIVDELIEFFGLYHKPQRRIWLNSLDIGSAQKALASMKDNKDKKYRDLYAGGLCRERADWLVGMSLSRAVTLALAQNMNTSIGRVQTPTLALVVNRCMEIENFKAKEFYELEIDVLADGKKVTLLFSTTDHEKRIWDKKVAEAIAAKLKGKTVPVSVLSAEKSVNPPPLFSLPDFQRFAGKNLKWGVAKSLEILQKLYDLKLTTYPRTESNKLPPEQEPDGLPIGKGLLTTGKFAAAKGLPLATRSSVYSCHKDEPHPAVVPTACLPTGFAEADLEKAWEIVANRFLMSLLPTYRFTETMIMVKEEGYSFTTKGEVSLIEPAKTWLALSNEKRNTNVLPSIKNGSAGVIQAVRVKSKSTSCPDYYTEDTLLEDMRSVAKFVTDPKLKAVLKENSGIGTPATQAATIELIQFKNYVTKSGQKLYDTPYGRSLILNIPNQLKDPGLTAAWEDALKMIVEGTYKPEDFMTRIDEFVAKRTAEVIALRGKVILSADTATKNSAGKTVKAKSAKPQAAVAKKQSPSARKPMTDRKSSQPAHKASLREF